jgi:hypothetical protein
LAVAPEQIENDKSNGNFFAQEQVTFPPAKPFLQFSKWQDFRVTHREDLAVQNQVRGEVLNGFD